MSFETGWSVDNLQSYLCLNNQFVRLQAHFVSVVDYRYFILLFIKYKSFTWLFTFSIGIGFSQLKKPFLSLFSLENYEYNKTHTGLYKGNIAKNDTIKKMTKNEETQRIGEDNAISFYDAVLLLYSFGKRTLVGSCCCYGNRHTLRRS